MNEQLAGPFPNHYCSQLSEQVGEQMVGTAAEATIWLALEYPAAWGAQAVAESKLSPAVKRRLAQWEADIPGIRVQLIKQRNRALGDAVTLFIAHAQEHEPRLYRFDLDACDALVDVDLASIVARDPRYDTHLHGQPIFLVCTNGKRDQCCARFGLPVYQAIARYAEEEVWRTTHTGGHRFAPTLVALPHGVVYGRVEAAEVADLVDAYRARSIHNLDRYRGRSCYPRVVQVADGFLRRRTQSLGLDALRFESVEQSGEDAWTVRFRSCGDGAEHSVALEERPAPYRNPASCGQAKLAATTEFCLI